MAFPTTIPTFDKGNDASQWVVWIGATTSTPLGQVRSFNWTAAKDMEEARRVSDTKKYRTAVGVDVDGTLELFQDNDNVEIELMTGAAGLTVETAPITLIAVFYDNTTTTGAAVATYTFTNWEVVSEEGGPRDAGSQTYWSYLFVAESVARS